MKKSEIIFRKKRAKDFLDKLIKRFSLKDFLKNKNKILDFGTGYGFFTKEMSKKFPTKKICGIDINKKRINFAIKNNKTSKIKYTSSRKISGKYDLILLMFVAHEIKDFKKVLKKLYFHLNKNGFLIIYDFKKVSKKDFMDLYKKDLVHKESNFYEEYKEHNRWTIKEFKKICEDVGLETIRINVDEKYFLFYLGEKK
jgi:ubiquinone/menaquinone biosynthesis C-methylase UbiE